MVLRGQLVILFVGLFMYFLPPLLCGLVDDFLHIQLQLGSEDAVNYLGRLGLVLF